MIELIKDLPDNVLGFKASGEVTEQDYEATLVPAVEQRLRKQRRVRLLYQMGPDFEGFDAAAMWQDAKVGMKHLSSWERVAIVTSQDWVKNATKAMGFFMPCEVRTFDNDELQDARVWITQPAPGGELSHELLKEDGILVLRPAGRLTAADFERVTKELDPYLEQEGKLTGVMIFAETFPGWEDLSALSSHMKFVKDHQRKIGRLAIVTDDKLLSALPRLGEHFISAEVRHFAASERNLAQKWLKES